MRVLVLAGLAIVGAGGVCAAQSSSSSSTSANSSSGQQDATKPTPASTTQSAPQASAKTQSQAKTGNPPTDDSSKKKVWTNDELVEVRGDVSVVGGAGDNSGVSKTSGTPKTTAYDKLVDGYQRKLSTLRGDLADLDRKIQLAKDAKGNSREDTTAWIAVQEKKREDILAKIERIQDEARHKGVLPGDLRE
jgi:hypothetical protein